MTDARQQLVQLMGVLLSPDNEQRKAAEAQVDAYTHTPGFFPAVADIATAAGSDSAGLTPSVRLLALTILKQRLAGSDAFTSDAPAVVESLLSCLADAPPGTLPLNLCRLMVSVITKLRAGPETSAEPSQDTTAVSVALGQRILQALVAVLGVGSSSSGSGGASSAVPLGVQWRFLLLLEELLLSLGVTAGAGAAEDEGESQCADTALYIGLLTHLAAPLFSTALFSSPEPVAAAAAETAGEVQRTALRCLSSMYVTTLTAPSSSPLRSRATGTIEGLSQVWQQYSSTLYEAACTPVSHCPSLALVSAALTLVVEVFSCVVSFSRASLRRAGGGSGASRNNTNNNNNVPPRLQGIFFTNTDNLLSRLLGALAGDADSFRAMAAAAAATAAESSGAATRDDLTRVCAKRWALVHLLLSEHPRQRAALPALVMAAGTGVPADAEQDDEVGLPYLQLVQTYCLLPEADAAELAADAGRFLAEEDDRDGGGSGTLRDVAAAALATSMDVLGPRFIHTTLEHLFGGLMQTDDEGGEAALRGWQEREAAIFSLEYTVRHRAAHLRLGGGADFSPLLPVLVQYDAASAVPAHAARALSFIAALVVFMRAHPAMRTIAPSVLATSFASLSAHACGDGTAAASVGLLDAAVCRLLARVVPLCNALTLRDAARAALGSCDGTDGGAAQQIAFAAEEAAVLAGWQRSLWGLALACEEQARADDSHFLELLYLTLDVLRMVLGRLAPATAPHAASTALPGGAGALLRLWRLRLADPEMGEAVADVFPLLLRVSGDSSLAEWLPWLARLLHGGSGGPSGGGDAALSDEEYCAVPSAVRLTALLLARGSEGVLGAALLQLLAALLGLLLATPESAVLSAAGPCLVAILQRCDAEQLSVTVPLADGQAASAPVGELLLRVAQRMLRPERGEAALLTVGPGLAAVAGRANCFDGGQLQERLLTPVVARLAAARTASAAEQLVWPLAVLLAAAPHATLQGIAAAGAATAADANDGAPGVAAAAVTRWVSSMGGLSERDALLASLRGMLCLLADWGGGNGAAPPPPAALASLSLTRVARTSSAASKSGKKRGKAAGATAAARSPVPLDVALFVGVVDGMLNLSEQLREGVRGAGMFAPRRLGACGDADDLGGIDSDGGDDEDEWEADSSDNDDLWEDAAAEEMPSAGGGGGGGAVDVAEERRRAVESAKSELAALFSGIDVVINAYATASAPFLSTDEQQRAMAFLNDIRRH